jgi:uncharacterized protein YndB with AHSA1/START domain
MTQDRKTLALDLRRLIAAPPAKVFAAWMDPKQPCNPWSAGKTLGLQPKVGSLYCIVMGGVGYIFGRILKLTKGQHLQFTWMSPHTHGQETTVTVHFKKHAGGTLMTLRHTGLPKDKDGSLHADGWNQFLGMMEKHFGG